MTSKEARGLSSQRWVRPVDRSGRSHESGQIQFPCSELNLCVGTPRTPQIVFCCYKKAFLYIFSSAPMLSQRLPRTSVPSALTRRDSDSRDRHFTGENCYSLLLFQFWNVWHHENSWEIPLLVCSFARVKAQHYMFAARAHQILLGTNVQLFPIRA